MSDLVKFHDWTPEEKICLCSPASDDQITTKARTLKRTADQMFKDGQALICDGEALCERAKELNGEADRTIKELWLSQEERGLMEVLR